MENKDRILKMIFEVVDELNKDLPEDKKLEKSENTMVSGESGRLDSLGIVNLIVAVEQKIEEKFGVSITLANEDAISKKDSPFKTIGTLANYALELLKNETKEDG